MPNQRPALMTFDCSSTVKFFQVKSGRTYFLKSVRTWLWLIAPGFVKLYVHTSEFRGAHSNRCRQQIVKDGHWVWNVNDFFVPRRYSQKRGKYFEILVTKLRGLKSSETGILRRRVKTFGYSRITFRELLNHWRKYLFSKGLVLWVKGSEKVWFTFFLKFKKRKSFF